MATIEPRLMHLLNDAKTPDLDLPPIQHFAFASSANDSLFLPPIENETGGQRGEASSSKQIPSFHTIADDNGTRHKSRLEGSSYSKESSSKNPKTGHPLQLLLEDPETNSSSHSLRMILDGSGDLTEDASTKKRHRALTVKDDFVQLPQPLKKQKSTRDMVFPPIINGLHEPPPDAAVFPPIVDDCEAPPNLNVLKEFTTLAEDRPASNTVTEMDKTSTAKAKRRAAKPRRKWSEEETNHLLLGVSRHGVGKWTSILEDPDFNFNDRTAGDLKDRFRTCCPDELRGLAGGKLTGLEKIVGEPTVPATDPKSKAKKALMLERILILDDEAQTPEKEKDKIPDLSQQDSDSAPKPRKSRAHRKKMEDLVELGISGPFKKSHRRERRPFTDQDDKEILDGLDQYGPAWTKIQRDPRFNLSSRQPTDLRDRVRNKYAEIYARIEKGGFQIKEQGRGNSLLEPTVNTTIENSLLPSISNHLEPQLNRSSSKEDISKRSLHPGPVESLESLPGTSGFEFNEPSTSAFMTSVGEMDISRLLLDDTHVDSLSNSSPSASRSASKSRYHNPGAGRLQ